ncbi:hypothetical protein AHF37_06103 [Paragonimus kellicotti]|nr:hypothetical protein AHF37_06103 [Paragonimus kellicotti]
MQCLGVSLGVIGYASRYLDHNRQQLPLFYQLYLTQFNASGERAHCLEHYGMTEMSYYTVLFGVSRAQGVLASLLWDRALGLPIERPKSLSTSILMNMVKPKAA